MSKLFVGTALPNFAETEILQKPNDILRLQNRNIAHGSSDGDLLNSDEFGLQMRFAVFEQHLKDFFQIFVQLVQRLRL